MAQFVENKHIQHLLEEFKNRPDLLLQALHKIMATYGYIDRSMQEATAQVLGIPLTCVAGVVSFYSFYHTEKYGKYVLRFCTSAPCHMNGANELLEECCKILKIGVDETTTDGMFTLKTCGCLGACAQAPAVLVNNHLYGPLYPEDVCDFINQLRQEAGE